MSDTVLLQLLSAMRKDVDCLLLVKPVAINNSGIRRDCAAFCFQVLPVAGSPH